MVEMENIIFEWDEAKAEANVRKHGIRFEDAAKVFNDPNHYTVQDRFENGEYRWQTIGTVAGEQVLLVAHVFRYRDQVEIIRLISARKATKLERKRYGNR